MPDRAIGGPQKDTLAPWAIRICRTVGPRAARRVPSRRVAHCLRRRPLRRRRGIPRRWFLAGTGPRGGATAPPPRPPIGPAAAAPAPAAPPAAPWRPAAGPPPGAGPPAPPAP